MASNQQFQDIISHCLADILQDIDIGIFVMNDCGKILYANTAALEICGLELEEVLGVDFLSLPKQLFGFLGYIYRAALSNNASQNFDRMPLLAKNGKKIHISGWIHPLRVENVLSGMFCSMKNVTDVMRLEEQLVNSQSELEKVISERVAELSRVNADLVNEIKQRELDSEALVEANDRYMKIFENASEGIGRISLDGMLIDANMALAQLLGYATPEDLRKSVVNAREQIFVDKNQWDAFAKRILNDKCLRRQEVLALTRNSTQVWLELSAYLTTSRWGQHCIEFLATDISEHKAKEIALYYRATVDVLCEVPNRALFMDRLTQAFNKAKRYGDAFALLFIDLDNFKKINDECGHRAGDIVLSCTARRMLQKIRSSDTLGRFGGDEFCVIVNNLESSKDAAKLARTLIRRVQEPIDCEGAICQVGASIGIAIFSSSMASPEDLLRCADSSMYEAKNLGGNTYVIHSENGKTDMEFAL